MGSGRLYARLCVWQSVGVVCLPGCLSAYLLAGLFVWSSVCLLGCVSGHLVAGVFVGLLGCVCACLFVGLFVWSSAGLYLVICLLG